MESDGAVLGRTASMPTWYDGDEDAETLLRFDEAAALREDDAQSRAWGAESTAETLSELIVAGLEVPRQRHLPRARLGDVIRVAVMREVFGVSGPMVTSGEQGRHIAAEFRIKAPVLDRYMADSFITPYLETIWHDVRSVTGGELQPARTARLPITRTNQALAASIAAGLVAIAGEPDPAVVKRRLRRADEDAALATDHADLFAFLPAERRPVLEHIHVWLVSELAQVPLEVAAARTPHIAVSAPTLVDLLRDRRVHHLLAAMFRA